MKKQNIMKSETDIKTHYKDTVLVMPKQKRAIIKRQFYRQTPNSKFKAIKRCFTILKEWELKNDIPKETYQTTQSFFDSSAFNNDDREYECEVTRTIYSISKIKEIEDYIKNKYQITGEIKDISS